MFTGIITDVGRVRDVVKTAGLDRRLTLSTAWSLDDVALGASIACSGVCLTVVDKGAAWFAVEASGETCARSTVGGWAPGRLVNLERALRMGDELGGHLVAGHVDGVAETVSATPEDGSVRWRFRVALEQTRFIASKGSVAVDGVSLTVNEVAGAEFGVNIIPHTQTHTTFRTLEAGDPVNIEVDLMARYAARLLAAGPR